MQAYSLPRNKRGLQLFSMEMITIMKQNLHVNQILVTLCWYDTAMTSSWPTSMVTGYCVIYAPTDRAGARAFVR